MIGTRRSLNKKAIILNYATCFAKKALKHMKRIKYFPLLYISRFSFEEISIFNLSHANVMIIYMSNQL